jgi:hypothetical protein
MILSSSSSAEAGSAGRCAPGWIQGRGRGKRAALAPADIPFSDAPPLLPPIAEAPTGPGEEAMFEDTAAADRPRARRGVLSNSDDARTRGTRGAGGRRPGRGRTGPAAGTSAGRRWSRAGRAGPGTP